ncbi:Holliday junction ATP-dependent DNA helicase RuvA [bioreactor metagenome]|uniref:Holliday junction ATP-dependent DNA helicase RuvA n=1 Tax=bioreactor metagenome TaxID=1076179 RepID=A0A645JLS3_9ZZZZ
MTPAELITAIVSSDAASISRAQGIGKKTAQRVILDLKDKIGNGDITNIFDIGSDIVLNAVPAGDERSEAVEALVSLGYSRSEALKAVSRVYIEGMNVQKLLSAALKEISKL